MNDGTVVILLDTDDGVRSERADVEWLAAGRRVERGAIQPHPRAVAAPFRAYDRRVELAPLGIVVIQALSHQSVPEFRTPPGGATTGSATPASANPFARNRQLSHLPQGQPSGDGL